MKLDRSGLCGCAPGAPHGDELAGGASVRHARIGLAMDAFASGGGAPG